MRRRRRDPSRDWAVASGPLPSRSATLAAWSPSPLPELSLGEWATLALLREEPTHGWAIVKLLAPAGEVGSVWSLSRPLVYRAAERLEAMGLVAPIGVQQLGARSRTLLTATGGGKARGRSLARAAGRTRPRRAHRAVAQARAAAAAWARSRVARARAAASARTCARAARAARMRTTWCRCGDRSRRARCGASSPRSRSGRRSVSPGAEATALAAARSRSGCG